MAFSAICLSFAIFVRVTTVAGHEKRPGRHAGKEASKIDVRTREVYNLFSAETALHHTAKETNKMALKYKRGHVRHPNKDAIIKLKHLEHGERLKKLATPTAPSFDWRSLGKVPPVRDQGQCGSCWDFSGCGTATMAIIQAGLAPADGTFDLSEQYVLDCGSNGGCDGDDNTTVLAEAQASGIADDSYGIYQAQANSCQPYGGALHKIVSWGFADSNGGNGVTSVNDIKEALVTYGPLGCAVAAGSDWDNYTGGVSLGSGSTQIDHDVMIVGWQDDATVQGGGYWIVRNSWGTSWGESGYMRLAYGADQIGTETVWAQAGPTPPPGPGPNPPPPPPGPGLATLTLPQALAAGNYTLQQAQRYIQNGITIPPWLAGLLADLCAIAPSLPTPWNGYLAIVCALLPPAGQKQPCGGCK